MKICIDSDSTGAAMKLYLRQHLGINDIFVTDLNSRPEDQYPIIAFRLAKRILEGEFERGVLICGTGLGMAMMANKVPSIYAGTPQTVEHARHMAHSNHAQVLTIGCSITPLPKAVEMVMAWLGTPFGNRPNAQRMRELEALQ